MHDRRVSLVNALCLSRIPLGAAVILIYSPHDITRFSIAVGIAVAALLTDAADGYLARRFGIVSDAGAILDGLGDKAFYIAIYMVIAEQNEAPAWLLWSLIIREVLLYGLRVIDPDRTKNTKKLRSISLIFAAVIRIYFLAFFANDLVILLGVEPPPVLMYQEVLAYSAAILGYYGLAMMAVGLSKKGNG